MERDHGVYRGSSLHVLPLTSKRWPLVPNNIGAKHNGLVIHNEYYNVFNKSGKETEINS